MTIDERLGILPKSDSKMVLIVPTRGRPQNMIRLYKALIETESNITIAFGTDSDDMINIEWALENIIVMNVKDKESKVDIWVHKSDTRKRFAPTLNDISMFYKDKFHYIAWCGDDHVPRTKNWDQYYRNILDEMKVGIVYGNDLYQGENIATELAFTSNIVEALGYAVPSGFVHLYVDNYFMELGRGIGKLRYLPDVVIEHMHPMANGKAAEDLTYQEANSPENWTNDRIRFEKYMQNEYKEDIEKLKELL